MQTRLSFRCSYLAFRKGIAVLLSICLVNARQSPRHSNDKYFKASFSSRRYRLMVYCLPSTAGQVGRAQTSLPICSAAFNWPHFGAGVHNSKHFLIWSERRALVCARQAWRAAIRIGRFLKKTEEEEFTWGSFIGKVKLQMLFLFTFSFVWWSPSGTALKPFTSLAACNGYHVTVFLYLITAKHNDTALQCLMHDHCKVLES